MTTTTLLNTREQKKQLKKRTKQQEGKQQEAAVWPAYQAAGPRCSASEPQGKTTSSITVATYSLYYSFPAERKMAANEDIKAIWHRMAPLRDSDGTHPLIGTGQWVEILPRRGTGRHDYQNTAFPLGFKQRLSVMRNCSEPDRKLQSTTVYETWQPCMHIGKVERLTEQRSHSERRTTTEGPRQRTTPNVYIKTVTGTKSGWILASPTHPKVTMSASTWRCKNTQNVQSTGGTGRLTQEDMACELHLQRRNHQETRCSVPGFAWSR